MDDDHIISLIQSQADESRNIEYKTGLEWKNRHSQIGWLQAKVIKAVLGLTNNRNGGVIILGVNDDGAGNREYVGLTEEQLATFRNVEAMQDCIGSYADLPIVFSVKQISVGEGEDVKTFIAININEFAESPVLAKKDLAVTKPNGREEYVIREGDLYVRSQSGRFGTVKASRVEFDEVVRLAHEKSEQRIRELFGDLTTRSEATTDTDENATPYDTLDADL